MQELLKAVATVQLITVKTNVTCNTQKMHARVVDFYLPETNTVEKLHVAICDNNQLCAMLAAKCDTLSVSDSTATALLNAIRNVASGMRVVKKAQLAAMQIESITVKEHTVIL